LFIAAGKHRVELGYIMALRPEEQFVERQFPQLRRLAFYSPSKPDLISRVDRKSTPETQARQGSLIHPPWF